LSKKVKGSQKPTRENGEDIFFNEESPLKNEPPSLKGIYEIFLAYFNEELGHLILFTYPPSLKTDEEECRVISIHSIWWLNTETQKDLQHVDLECGGRTYLATKYTAKSFREKKRSGLTTETPETFVLITSVPNNLTHLGTNMLRTLFERIQDIKDELYLLIEKEITCVKIIKNPSDKEIIKKGAELEAKLLKICEESIPKLTPDELNALTKVETPDQENLAFLLLEDLHLLESPHEREFDVMPPSLSEIAPPDARETEVFKKKIEIESISLMDDDRKLKITVKNVSGQNLENLTIRITQLKEFFEAAAWQTTIDIWFTDEELIFQYPRIIGEDNDEYMLRIENTTGKLLAKKITCHNFKPKGIEET
jgi:hypothetical protein